MRAGLILGRASLAIALTVLAACSLYNAPYRTAQVQKPGDEYTLQYIEADDRGWFWHPEQADAALASVKKETAEGDTLVVLFIHGWHHSAACYDDNAEAFKQVLHRLHDELQQKMYQTARETLHGNAPLQPVKIVGIYVGWRGRSLPGLIDYTTFWGRKSAAKRVGEGDLQEFMDRLQRLYNDHTATQTPSADPKPFFGLVSIGHSFGGAVLLAATSRYFEKELERASPDKSGFLRARIAAPKDTETPVGGDANAPPLQGFGDLVVLVNPAVEAAAYERINVLSRGVTYGPAQIPLLVTFSARNDQPRNTLFKPGRIAGEFFTSAASIDDDRERAAEREALGVYDFDGTGLTHRLMPMSPHKLIATEMHEDPDSQCAGETPGTFEWWRWDDEKPATGTRQETLNVAEDFNPQAAALASFDFAKDMRLSDLEMEQMPQPLAPWQPFLVVSVDSQVINGHNGIFSEPFMRFLLRYIGFAEAKRYLLAAEGKSR